MKQSRLIFAVCSALLLAACDSPTATRPAFAYDPTSLSQGRVYRYPSGVTISVYAEPDGTTSNELSTAVTRAIAAWNSVPRFREYTLAAVTVRGAADIVVYDRRVPSPLKPGNCVFDPRGAGYTYFCIGDLRFADVLDAVDGAGGISRVLISVDRGAVSSTEAYDAVVAHELGHALGIGGHSLDPADIMYGAPTVATPSNRDRQTLLYVLGANPWALLKF